MLEFASLDRAAFADVVDETQPSLELYFHARELNRAQHVELGLPPPDTALLPPRDAEAYAAPDLSRRGKNSRCVSICLRRAIELEPL